jgi:hypothetical protein
LCDAVDLASIHCLEENGFRFIEFRIFKSLAVEEQRYSAHAFHPFAVELLSAEEFLEPAMKILHSWSSDDRFSEDPLINPELAKKRLECYVKRSFHGFPQEFVFGLVNTNSGKLLAFQTGRFEGTSAAHYFYSFVKIGSDPVKMGAMLEAGLLQQLASRNISRIHSVSSGANIGELNASVNHFAYQIDRAAVLLRKVFD